MAKRILAAILTLAVSASLAVPVLAEGSRFGDVPSNHWAAEAIRRANEDGVMVGTGTFPETGLARFEPDADLTSAQFAVIMTGALYRDIPDEAAGPWYAPFQTVMEDAGWDEGAGILDWEAPMTRYQMAAVLYNIAEDQGVLLPNRENLEAAQDGIADWEQIPAEYRRAVAVSYVLDLLSGVDEAGTFAGDRSLTRAQAAVVYGKLKDALFASGGPMERILEEREQQLAAAGLSYEFTRYDGRKGAVYVSRQFGTPHGTICCMEYVARDGARLNIQSLLPGGYRLGTYLDPTEIQLDETGDKLTFVTPIEEGIPNETPGPDNPSMWLDTKDWGLTRCTVDLTTGTVEAMEPVAPFGLPQA